MLLTLTLTGCLNLDFRDIREGRILLQVHDARTAAAVSEVVVRVLNFGDEVARGTTNAAGYVGLTFQAPSYPGSSERPGLGTWVTLLFERAGQPAIELPCGIDDFVESGRLRVLTRGVALRRAT